MHCGCDVHVAVISFLFSLCLLAGSSVALVPLCCTHRRRSGWNSGDAWRALKVGRCRVGWGIKGVSPPQPTMGSGGASLAPPAGSGAEPRPKTNFGIF